MYLDPIDVGELAMFKAVHANDKAVALLRNAFLLAEYQNDIDAACIDDYQERCLHRGTKSTTVSHSKPTDGI